MQAERDVHEAEGFHFGIRLSLDSRAYPKAQTGMTPSDLPRPQGDGEGGNTRSGLAPSPATPRQGRSQAPFGLCAFSGGAALGAQEKDRCGYSRLRARLAPPKNSHNHASPRFSDRLLPRLSTFPRHRVHEYSLALEIPESRAI